MKEKKLRELFKKSKKLSSEKKIICENYIKGDQISTEGIFINRKYYGLAFSDRNYDKINFTKPNIVENGGTVPSKYSGEYLKNINKVMRQASKSLGINFGTIKGDIIINDKKIYIVELAARLSGGYFASHTIPMAYGINIVKISLLCALNKKISKKLIYPKFFKYHSQRYIFSINGKVKNIKFDKAILKKKYLKEFKIFIKKNQYLKKITSHPDRRGMTICSGKDHKNSINNSNNIIKNIKIILK
jgi:predicted ATP-grasp superfamily ATP-dependent carboligase